MTRTVHDALVSFDDYAVERRLHDVPPHEVYAVRVDGRRAVCKVAAHPEADPAAEAALVHHVDEHTGIPAPSVLDAGAEYFVATWLDGLPDDPAVTGAGDTVPDAYARALGAGLARLHEETAGTFARPGYPDPELAADADSSGDAVASGGTDAPVDTVPVRLRVDAHESMHALALALLEEFEGYLAEVGWADPVRAVRETVADRPGLFAGGGPPVVCHGNFLPEHVGFAGDPLAADGTDDPARLAGVVDFEHGLVAPAEYDVWRTVFPVFGSPARGSAGPAFDAFRAGYESVRSLPHGFERREPAYALLALASYFVALDLQNGGIGEDERPQAERMAESVAEIAADVRNRRVG